MRAIQLPQDSGLADREDQLLAAGVDEHALVHLVEVQRLARRVLEMPRQLAVVDVERDGRGRVERGVEDRVAAARRHPRLGLRDAPVGEVQIGIVAAGDPGLAALAEGVGDLAPRLPAGLAGVRQRVELPGELPGRGVVGADEAAVGAEARAALQPLDHLAARHDRTARVREPQGPVGDHRRPDVLAVARVESDQPGIGGGENDLVLVDREVAHRPHPDLLDGTDLVFPDEIARRRVDRLHDVPRLHDVHRAAVDDRHVLVRADVVPDRPDPRQPQVLHVVAGDLGERAVAPRLVVAARHQPVARRRIAQHLVGDRHVVLHFTTHGQAARRGRRAAAAGGDRIAFGVDAAAARARAATRGSLSASASRTCGAAAGVGRLGRGLRLRGGPLARGDGADRYRRRRGQRLRARGRAVGPQDVGDDREVLIVAETGAAGRHRRADESEERVDTLRAPDVHEVGARELRRFVSAAQIGDVTTGAARLIGRAAGIDLCRGEHRRAGRLLSRCEYAEDAEASRGRRERESRLHRFVS